MAPERGPGPAGSEEQAQPAQYERLGVGVWVAGAVMALLGAVAAVLMVRDFSSDSYVYLAFYTIPANTAISLFPHEPALIWFGKHGSVVLAAAAAAVGTLAAGWLDHRVFVPVMNLRGLAGYKELAWYRKVSGWFRKQPFWTLVLTGFTPIPFFPFKFLAFSVGYPLGRYLAALLAGRIPRYMMLAWVGRLIAIPDWILVGFFAAISIAYAWNGVPKLITHVRSRRAGPAGPIAAQPSDETAAARRTA